MIQHVAEPVIEPVTESRIDVTSTQDPTSTPDTAPPVSLHAVPTVDSDSASEPVKESAGEPSETEPATGSTSAPPAGAEPAGADLVDEREQARAVWLASVESGEPLSGRELGERFGRSERWGRARIGEARGDKPAGPRTGGTTARRRGRAGADRGAARQDATVTAREVSNSAAASSAVRDDRDGGTDTRGVPAPDMPAVPAGTVPAGTVVLPGGARLVAWAGFLFGTVISVAANVLHAWLPALAHEAPAPGLAPQVGAAVWPIALVISVEVLSRVPWRTGWSWRLARYGGAGVVAVGAAVISYGHLHGVLDAWGYGTTGAAVGPLVVDGLMTISGFALLAMSDHGKAATR